MTWTVQRKTISSLGRHYARVTNYKIISLLGWHYARVQILCVSTVVLWCLEKPL